MPQFILNMYGYVKNHVPNKDTHSPHLNTALKHKIEESMSTNGVPKQKIITEERPHSTGISKSNYDGDLHSHIAKMFDEICKRMDNIERDITSLSTK